MYHSRLVFALAMAALATILVPSSLTAQITFQRTYGGELSDGGGSVQQTADGGYIYAGSTKSYGAGDADIYLIKTDARGDTLWSRAFGGIDVDYGYEVQQTTDNGYIITGVTFSFGGGMGDIWLIKTNANGDTLWARTFGDTNPQWGYAVRQTFDGGYIVVGNSGPYGGFDIWLIKTNAGGDTLWTRLYGGPFEDRGNSVRQTADSGYIITGLVGFDGDAALIKTNAAGDTEWTRTYGGTDFDQGYSVQQTADGGYIIAGDTRSFGAGGSDLYLVKTAANGDTQWTRTFGGADEEWGYSVQQAADSGYIFVGQTRSFGAGDYDIYLIRTNRDGDTLWTRTFGGSAEDGAMSVRQTADGGCIIGGGTNSFGVGGDVYLVKTTADGRVAVAEPKAHDAPRITLYAKPNPTTGRTTIRLSPGAQRLSPANLRVYDASGCLVHSVLGIRALSFPLDLRALPSGVYLARLDAAGRRATQRIVLQR